MFKIFGFIISIVFSLALSLVGCGADEDEPLTSIHIPIQFAPSVTAALAQDSARIDITITGPGIVSPISTTRVIAIFLERSGYTTADMTIPNVPIGRNRRVAIDVLVDGEVFFRGTATLDLLSGGSNRVNIPVRWVGPDITPLSESIIGTWRLTNTINAGSLLTLNRDGTLVIENALGALFGVYTLVGDELTSIFDNGNIVFTTVSIIDNRMILSDPVGIFVDEIYQRQ